MKELYIELATLLSSIEQVKWVDLWSEQIDILENDLPFPVPAVFLEFSSNGITDLGNNSQSINMQVDVIILDETMSNTFHGSSNQNTALKFMDIMELVNAKLHGSKGNHYGGMRRLDFRPERMGTAQLAYRAVYECTATDMSAANETDTVTGDDIQINRTTIPDNAVERKFDF